MKTGRVTIIEHSDFDGNTPMIIGGDCIDYLPNEHYIQCRESEVVLYYNELTNQLKIIKNRYSDNYNLDNDTINEMSLFTKLKMFWFTRWLATNYEGTLNTQLGEWYIEQIKHFNENVFPTMLDTEIQNNRLEPTLLFLKEKYESI